MKTDYQECVMVKENMHIAVLYAIAGKLQEPTSQEIPNTPY